ncbi:MAG: protein kinase [Proteobacteria bacterium]|nr:protein kinase [Pseudomonadota bacterium]
MAILGTQLSRVDDMQALSSSLDRMHVDPIKHDPLQHPLARLTTNPSALTYISAFAGDKIQKDDNPVGIANTVLFLKNYVAGARPIMTLAKRDGLDQVLGKTSKVKVVRAYDVLSGAEIALKKASHYDSPTESASEKAQDLALKEREKVRERRALMMLHRYYGELSLEKKDRKVDYIAQELVNGDDVAKFLNKKNDLLMIEKDQSALKEHFEDLVKVAYLFCQEVHAFNALGMIHRDIKPENMMVNKEDGNFTLKLIDFGGAIHVSEAATDLDKDYGTQGYKAPEIEQGQFSFATDAYAVGASLSKFTELMNAGCFRIFLAKNKECKAIKEALERVSHALMDPIVEKRMRLSDFLTVLAPLGELLAKQQSMRQIHK